MNNGHFFVLVPTPLDFKRNIQLYISTYHDIVPVQKTSLQLMSKDDGENEDQADRKVEGAQGAGLDDKYGAEKKNSGTKSKLNTSVKKLLSIYLSLFTA